LKKNARFEISSPDTESIPERYVE